MIKIYDFTIILAKTTGRRAIMSESAGTRLVNTPDEVKGGGFNLEGTQGLDYIVEGI